MREFAALYEALDASTGTADKVAALVRHLSAAEPADAAWAVYVLAGGKPRQVVRSTLLREAACRKAGIDDWLFEACYEAAGDLAETIAHVLPPGAAASDAGLAHWMEQRVLPLRALAPAEQVARVSAAWDELDAAGRFLLVKLIGGGFRVGVSRQLVQRALAELTGLDPQLLAQRLVGWTDARTPPDALRWQALVAPPQAGAAPAGQPYPFFLAQALQADPASLGDLADWLVEWKFDGIRAQLVKRSGQVWLWSRGEELITERFPEVVQAAQALPDGTVLDGELLVWLPGQPQPAAFQRLQTRINRSTLSRKLLAEAPVRFIAYDLLEQGGQDQRKQTQWQRRARLEALLQPALGTPEPGAATAAPELLDLPDLTESAELTELPPPAAPAAQPLPGDPAVLGLSPRVQVADWSALAALRETARRQGMEGFMLKHGGSRYGSGRTRSEGLWLKWKVDPYTVDAVLVYAQAGHGRRAGLYTDYSFAVWSRPPADAAEAQAVVEAITRREPPAAGALQLLSFAKAYSGLSDEEFKAVDRVIRATTLEKFGPVRSLRPTLVFELGFEGIQASPRHKSGVAVRFPRMLRIRHDKPLHEADSLATLQRLMAADAPA